MRHVVRRARPDQWPLVREVRLRALADAPGVFASTLTREQAFDDDEWRRRTATSAWFLARSDEPAGTVVGVAVGIDDPDQADARHLVGMWVDQDRRGSGLAGVLVDAVAGWAVDDGASALALWVVDGNEPARRCYERAGFHATGERQPLPSDPRRLESRMVRLLGRP